MIRGMSWKRTLILCLAGLTLITCKESVGEEPFMPPGETIPGYTCEEVITHYTSWAFFRDPVAPVACGEGISPDIWYVSDGGANEQGEVFCTMPDDVSLMFLAPQLYIFSCPEVAGASECDFATDRQQQDYLEDRIHDWSTDNVILNGQRLDADYEQYNCLGSPTDLIYDPNEPSRIFIEEGAFGPGVPPYDFDCSSPWTEPNDCNMPAGPRRATMGGAFFVLYPLPAGEHVVQYTNCLVDVGCIDYTVYLTVVPRAEL